MRIASSTINMNSARSFQRTVAFSRQETTTAFSPLTAQKKNLKLDSKIELLEAKQKELSQKLNELKKQQSSATSTTSSAKIGEVDENSTFKGLKPRILREILERIKNFRLGEQGRSKNYTDNEGSTRSATESNPVQLQDFSSASLGFNGGNIISGRSGVWQKQITMSTFLHESEVTNFSSVGKVTTSDGREINFNINLEMSRSFTEVVDMQQFSQIVNFTDPLTFSLDGSVPSLSDQKFLFDIDSDGTKENVSLFKDGAGVLALDKNNDGKINDGSELFGTKSGDGFKDLAIYDMDGNGWIDENDPIFSSLKIWTKDESGNDKLIGIGDADIGAIHLGNVSTEFSLNSAVDNSVNGRIRSSGVFLKESGGVGTVHQIDLAT